MYKIKIFSKDKIEIITRRWGNVIKQIAWKTFKNTGDINTFLELIEVENVEKNIVNGEENGNNQNKWDNNSRK